MKTISAIIACSLLSAAAGYVIGVKQSVNVHHDAPAVTNEPAQEVTPLIEEALEPAPPNLPSEPLPEEEPLTPSAHAARADQTMQTLTDNQGRTINAKILAVQLDQVTIRREDGFETTFPIAMLSPKDIELCHYIRDNAPQEQTAEEFDWDAIFGDG